MQNFSGRIYKNLNTQMDFKSGLNVMESDNDQKLSVVYVNESLCDNNIANKNYIETPK